MKKMMMRKYKTINKINIKQINSLIFLKMKKRKLSKLSNNQK
jgi:hypothetical protein